MGQSRQEPLPLDEPVDAVEFEQPGEYLCQFPFGKTVRLLHDAGLDEDRIDFALFTLAQKAGGFTDGKAGAGLLRVL